MRAAEAGTASSPVALIAREMWAQGEWACRLAQRARPTDLGKHDCQ